MTLHIVQSSPTTSNALRSCIAVFAKGDCLVLIADGVYGAAHPELSDILDGCYLLDADATARGLSARASCPARIDYATFVELTTRNHPIVNWG